jgi:hypothetical protein
MTNDEHPLHDRCEQAESAADLVADALDDLFDRAHMPREVFLAGAHAAIVSLMVHHLGGPLVAHSCEQAAERVRNLPSARAFRLAAAPPAGSA